LQKVTVPANVKSIGKSAFCYCSGLTSVALPDGLESLALYAFDGCSSLESIHLPDTITSIGWQCFAECDKLSAINLPLNWIECPSTDSTIDTDHCGHIFEGCKALKAISIPDGFTVPAYGLCYADYLEMVTFAGSTGNSIIHHSFYGCSRLQFISIPSGVTTLEKSAFCYCSQLSSVDLPDGLTELKLYAFNGCSSLESIHLPDTITSIGWQCFAECDKLSAINLPRNWIECPSTDSTIDTDHCGHIFQGCKALATITVPDGLSVPSYGLCYSDYVVTINLPENATEIKNHVFYGCSNLENINIPKTITYIGKSAFCYCSSLKQFDIPDGITEIIAFTFNECKSLQSIVIPDSVTGIGYHAFAGCVNLTNVTLSKNWNSCPSSNASNTGTGYQGGIFNGCTSLLSISVPDGVTTLPAYAFCNCDKFKSVHLPESLTSIPAYAFYGCTDLLLIQTPSGINSISKYAFYNCSSVQIINLSDTVQSVGNYAFYNVSSSAMINYSGDESSWSNISFGQSGNGTITSAAPNFDYNLDSTFGLVRPTSLGNCFYSSPDGVSYTNFYGFTGAYSSATSEHGLIDVNDAFFGLNAYDTAVSIPIDSFITLRFPNVVYFSNDSILYIRTEGVVYEKADVYAVTESSDLIFICTATEDTEDQLHRIPLSNLNTGIIGLKLVGRDLDGASPGFDVVDLYLMAHETSVEADYSSKTTVSMMRDGKTHNLLKEMQEFEQGEDEYVTLIVTPDWQNFEHGYITVTQRGNTVLKNQGGTFVDANPGRLFSPLESVYVTLVDAGGNIVESLKLKLKINAKTSSRLTVNTSETAITVYENTHGNSSRTDDYRVSKDAKVVADGTEYLTDKHGMVVIPKLSSGSITVSKQGYTTRTITADQISVSPKVYLQPVSNSGPVVTAVWVGNTDVLNQSLAIGLLSDQSTTFKAEVDWGNSSYGGIALMQDARTVKFNGDSLTTILKNNFDVTSTIYIVATDAAGKTTKKALKFEPGTVSAIPNILNGAGFSISDKISITLPDNIKPDFFAGQKINVGVSSIIPVTISAEDGKVYVAIGVDLVSYSKSDKWASSTETGNRAHVLKEETKSFVDKFKDTGILDTKGAASSLKKLKNLEQTYRTAIKYPQGSFGFDADFTILGFAEGYYDSQGNVTWLDGGVILNPSVSVSTNLPFALGPIPMYFEASLSANVQAQLNIIFDEAAKKFTPNGEISGEISLSGGVGFGVKKVLYGGGGVEGKLKPDWRIYAKAQDYFKLTASVNAYAKVGIVFFEYKKSWDPFYNEVWVEYPKANAAQNASLMGTAEFYDAVNYELKELNYLDDASAFTANHAPNRNAMLMSISPQQSFLNSSVMKTNLYRESTPQYVCLPDGNALAVWPDSTSSNINAIQLYYSYYNGATWSNPELVSNDGTLDYAPYLTEIGDSAYLVWQNATKSFSTADSLESIAPYFDIAVAKFDEEAGFTTAVIPNDGLDMLPTICGNGTSLYAAWVNNGQNDWFGNNSENSILYSEWSDGTWSAPVTAYSGLSSIDAVAADCNGGLHIAYAMDTDGDVATAEDVRVFENGKRVTSSDCEETFPTYHNHQLYWNSNGAVISSVGETQNEVNAVGNYQLLEVSGEKALVYAAPNGLASTLSVSYYNKESEQWSEPLELTDGSTFIGAFSAASKDGEIHVLFNSQSVIGDYTSDNPYGASELTLLSLTPYCDLTMGELIYSPDEYCAGSDMELAFDLTNNGSQVIESTTVEISDESGNVLSSIVLDDVIVPGQTIAAASYYAVSASATGQTLRVTATPTEYSDENPSDNSQTASFAFEDLSVENVTFGKTIDRELSVSANIVNRGYTTRSNILVELRKDQADGTVVKTEKVSSLGALSLAVVSFSLPSDSEGVYYVVLKNSGDDFTANDEDYVFLTETQFAFAEIDSVSNTGAQIFLSNERAGTCIVAVYNTAGKMLASGVKAVTAEAGAVDIPFSSEISLPTHYVVKVFLVDETFAPIYEAVTREF
jgi:hypothetical protein